MSRGKTRARLLGIQGMLLSESGDDYSYIYKTSTVRDSRFYPGYEITIPGLGTFVYSKSSAACISGQGCEFTDTGVITITTLSTAQSAAAGSGVIGTKTVEIPATAHAALAEDELRGGFIIIFNGTDNNVDFRQIIGNDVSANGAALTVYLAGGTAQTITTSSKVEVYANPYSALRTGTSQDYPKAGVPAAPVSAALKYFWCQRVGFCWPAPQANLGNTGGKTGGFWHDVGNVSDGATALGVSIPAAKSCQYAGHTVAGSISGNGPLFYLIG